MAWTGNESNRQSELPADWPRIRKGVLARDGGRCVWRLPSGKRCPRVATDVDHINSPDDHRRSNLRGLCAHHHKKRTSLQGRMEKAKRWAKAPRPAEDEPGRLG